MTTQELETLAAEYDTVSARKIALERIIIDGLKERRPVPEYGKTCVRVGAYAVSFSYGQFSVQKLETLE